MPRIRIGTKDYVECLQERLYFELDFLKEDGILIDVDEIKQGEIRLFECRCSSTRKEIDEKVLLNIFKEYIANVLSDVIINYFEEDFLLKILRANYRYLDPEEENSILKTAKDRLNFLVSKEDKTAISQIQRKNRILLEIVEYLDFEDEIILEGFLRFRLQSYLAELELAIDSAVDEFVIESEYEEFVHLLKYFIENQDTKTNLINVIKTEDDHFKLLNEEGILIENTYLDEHILNMVDCELDYEDLLISALITTAPEEIFLHFKSPASLIEILKKVFEEKVSVCLGCEYCKINNLKEKE
ncbi:putative sporulation protein YtxC [Halonatronum saccharophilum]|uniref:putative sporulation protein YtxC n=1 Tax=Halonatronum saccharophilum TaxID=150060 RepID=UPI000488D838|nr:putative sporulation protein YtxC [Halonatronum saccharophilum]